MKDKVKVRVKVRVRVRVRVRLRVRDNYHWASESTILSSPSISRTS